MEGIYYTLYNLIATTFYGSVTLTGWQEMTLTLISTIACLFAIAVPFIVVYKVICIIVGR